MIQGVAGPIRVVPGIGAVLTAEEAAASRRQHSAGDVQSQSMVVM